jgi:hypothetical protein
MKLIALAAALAFGGVAVAQTTPADQSQPSSAMQPAPADSNAMPDQTPPPADTAETPKGGYQPSTPMMSGTPMPGQPVVFRASTQTPDQAFPPPAPLESYPICKKNQFDKCRQRGGK